jgi:serine-type D-Ala-D-Ala carboxypeptidase/endopeptidase (penicillin-binding protein 4)
MRSMRPSGNAGALVETSFMLALFAAAALDALFSSATLSGAHTGALVVDAQSGKTVYARNADDAFIPASTMKLIVGSAALEVLGNAFAFTTVLATDGTTLYLKGGGDPLLSQQDANDAAAAVRALNLTSFPGGLHVDASRYDSSRYPDGWQIDDLPYDYAAPVSAVSFAENALHITVTPGKAVGDRATITVEPSVESSSIVNRVLTGENDSEDTTDIEDAGNATGYGCGVATTIVTGSVPLNQKNPATLDAAALEPGAVAFGVFAKALTSDGVMLGTSPAPNIYGTTPPNARVLWQHSSERLPELVRDMWQPSNNLLAETLLDEIGKTAIGDRDDRSLGIGVEERWLSSLGVNPKTLTIADGSGMSAYDRATPHALVAILEHDWNSPLRPTVLAALPVAGRTGTLERVFAQAPLAGNVIAKTGTSNHTRTLAGFLQTPKRTLIFALMVNDWMDSGTAADGRLRAFQQAFLTDIRAGASGV